LSAATIERTEKGKAAERRVVDRVSLVIAKSSCCWSP
jgi:hypothetical protein